MKRRQSIKRRKKKEEKGKILQSEQGLKKVICAEYQIVERLLLIRFNGFDVQISRGDTESLIG